MTTDWKVDKKITEAFFRRHVRGDVSDVIRCVVENDMGNDSPLSDQDMDKATLLCCPDCGDIICCNLDELEDFADEDVVTCCWCNSAFHVDDVALGTYNFWYLVSDAFAEELDRRGEVVIAGKYWGSDSKVTEQNQVIYNVCEELEMLSGQRYCAVK